MSTATFLISGVVLTAIAALMIALPAMMRPTVPLGVSVPSGHLDEPVIHSAIRRYRILVALIWLAGILVLAVSAASASPAIAVVIILVVVVGQFAAYVVSRRLIIAAKKQGDWFEGVPVRMAASVDPGGRPRVPVGWFIAALLLLGAAYAVLIVLYPSLPSTVPTGNGAGGRSEQYVAKSVWSVFGILFIGTIPVVGLFALSFLGRLVPIRALPGASAQTNARRAREMRATMSTLIGRVLFLIAVVFAWSALTRQLAGGASALIIAGPVIALVLLAASVAVFALRWRRLMANDTRLIADERGGRRPVDTPDDDRYWRAGIFYVNRDDAALFVQRRFGVGWTINLGHPAGIAIGVVVLLLVIGLLTFVLVHAAMRG
ncbi:DUF5808 domain-containing protein [Leifsonia sp. 2MCAF36]|uniref:DUF5808 domain-containing protein n=1 Tax=Leifsonia sp. 2MCAF36 TaxID=3232988 RepID=UPI003F9CF9D5